MTTESHQNPIFSGAGILIVDDDPSVLSMLADICEQVGFKNVFRAKNGFDALKLLARHTDEIDLLSLDLVMPDMSGLKLAETVANTHSRIVGIVMLTGFASTEYRNDFHSIKTDIGLTEDFLSKPIDLPHLLKSYENALTDVFAKRESQVELELTVVAKDLKRAIASQSLTLAQIENRVNALQHGFNSLNKNMESISERIDSKPSADLGYVLVLTFLFLVVTAALAWASTYLPVLSVLALASVTVLVLMLIAVFDLSKGGKLSERSLMEVLKQAFKFIEHRGKRN